MKRTIFSALLFSLLLVSCGGDEESEGSSGPALCDCVNIDEDKADDELKETCKKMEKEWKAKFKDASDEEQKKMREELQECEKSK